MPFWKFVSVVLPPIFLLGCATIQNDNVGAPLNKPSGDGKESLTISANFVENLSSEYFGYFDFTIENSSEKWIVVKVKSVEFDSLGSNENVRFPTWQEQLNWQAAMRQRIQIEEYNKALALGAIAGAGLGLAAASDNDVVRSIGAAATIASAGTMVGKGMGRNLDSLQLAKAVQENNLLLDSSVVLPGLFVKKWLLVNTKNHEKTGYLTAMTLAYSENGLDKAVRIQFRKKNTIKKSKWQSKIQESSSPTVSSTFTH
ncbi:MAG: hypothetical protein ABI036_14100 [Fibrobacteria bacterium]